MFPRSGFWTVLGVICLASTCQQVSTSDESACESQGKYFDSHQHECVACPQPSLDPQQDQFRLAVCEIHPVCCAASSAARTDQLVQPTKSTTQETPTAAAAEPSAGESTASPQTTTRITLIVIALAVAAIVASAVLVTVICCVCFRKPAKKSCSGGPPLSGSGDLESGDAGELETSVSPPAAGDADRSLLLGPSGPPATDGSRRERTVANRVIYDPLHNGQLRSADWSVNSVIYDDPDETHT